MYATALRYVPFALRGTSVHPRALKLHGGRSPFCEESRREARRRPKRPCARLQKASSRPISHSARFLRVRNARARSVGSTHPLPRPARSAPRGSAHPRAAPPSPSAGRGGLGAGGCRGELPPGSPDLRDAAAAGGEPHHKQFYLLQLEISPARTGFTLFPNGLLPRIYNTKETTVTHKLTMGKRKILSARTW